jgi:ribosomal protein S15P/S13E
MSYSKPHFFILNKGLNTGKPLSEPCPNCFVIQFGRAEDSENMEAICKSLWRAKFWHQFLIGSVIPYIRIHDFAKNLMIKSNEMTQDFEQHKKDVATLKLLLQKEEQFQQNINLINDLRRVILHRYCKR